MTLWLEIWKLVASFVTPIVVAILGVLVLRRVESVKAVVARESEFNKKWADEFFVCGQQFMQALERELALLTVLSRNPTDKLATSVREEVTGLHKTLTELELRIRLRVVFAPTAGRAVLDAAHDCFSLTGELVASRRGSVDKIIEKMNDFNSASRKAYAEMLGLGIAEQGATASAAQPRKRMTAWT